MTKRGPKVSQEMERARALMENDPTVSQRQAAKETGLSPTAISKAQWYRDLKAKRESEAK